MRRGRIFFYLAFILILGLVAVVVIYLRFLQPITEPPVADITPTPVTTVNIVAVTQRVPRGDVLNETVLGMVPVQEELVIQGYFTDLGQVVGRRARVDLEANMLLTSGMVAETVEGLSATGSNAALSIPQGMVAVSIPIDLLSSVSYAPQAGDHVNVIVNLLMVDLDPDFQSILPNNTITVIAPAPGAEGVPATLTATTQGAVNPLGRVEIEPLLEQTFFVVPVERQRPRLVTQMLLQDAVVLQVGPFPLAEPQPTPTPVPPDQPEPAGETQESPGPQIPRVITLIVTPQDAVTLNYLLAYNETGLATSKLTLALRSAGDDSRVQTEAATLDFLLTQYNIPVPVKLPYGIEPRVDYSLPSLIPGGSESEPAPQQ